MGELLLVGAIIAIAGGVWWVTQGRQLVKSQAPDPPTLDYGLMAVLLTTTRNQIRITDALLAKVKDMSLNGQSVEDLERLRHELVSIEEALAEGIGAAPE